LIRGEPVGNLELSTAIVCSGSLPSKVIQLFQFMNCATISNTTFFKYQAKYVHPAIDQTWKDHQQQIITKLREEKKGLIVGGDARCDSPGYCAKFGSYTMMEMRHNLLLNIELVQVSVLLKEFVHYIVVYRVMKFRAAHIWKRRGLFVESDS
jgi:solute carrier family 8 (sodium/calcium exchanger)